MSGSSQMRGGTPVGYLHELPAVEVGAVVCLRLWCGGPDQLDAMRADLGRDAIRALESICQLCALHGRRPLVRHAPKCKCLGSDEACFANFIATAAEGQREDALMIAMTLVRADMAPALVSSAQEFGLALKRSASQVSVPAPVHMDDRKPAYIH